MQVDNLYLYDGVLVVRTGRTALRILKSGKKDELIEITPSDQMIGSWKKWVRESELYTVQ